MNRLGPSWLTWLSVVCATIAGAAPPTATELDCRLPAAFAGETGLAVRVAVPSEPRYGTVAPVVVLVDGGWGGGNLARVAAPLTAQGFIEVRFCFPGGGSGWARSGGVLDYRGPASVQAAATVAAFAAGRLATTDGRRLADLTAPVRPDPAGFGLVGWGQGANLAIVALAEFEKFCAGAGWLLAHEAPAGPLTVTGLTGDVAAGPNAAYGPTTGQLDLTSLRWTARLPVRALAYGAGPAGSLWFDLDGDGRPGPSEPVPWTVPVVQPGEPLRFAYPPPLSTALASGRLVDRWPSHILPPAAATEFWRWREPSPSLLRASLFHRELMLMVTARRPDHWLLSPDSRHVVDLYQGWFQAQAGWLRLNPDLAYLRAVAGDAAAGLGEQLLTWPLTAEAIVAALPAAEAITAADLILAGAAELADRLHHGARDDLDAPLVVYPTPEAGP